MIVDDVVGQVARLAQLLQHDILLAGEVASVEMRLADEIGDQLDAEFEMFAEQPGLEGGLVARRIGVEIAADILDRLGDLARVAATGALEHHMLEQVGEAVGARLLVPRAAIGMQADRDRLDARHRIGGDGEAIGKPVDVRAGHAVRRP